MKDLFINCNKIKFKRTDPIFIEGDEAESVFIVQKGSCALFKKFPYFNKN